MSVVDLDVQNLVDQTPVSLTAFAGDRGQLCVATAQNWYQQAHRLVTGVFIDRLGEGKGVTEDF